jgi:hypothetical protein
LAAVVPPWPKALGVALVIVVAALGATPALAAPEWGITMTHANAYGLQAGECPGGKAKYVPGEPEEDCGVDPFTGSGTTFAQESGFDTYTITVKNTAPVSNEPEVLTCNAGVWEGEPTFSYQWLRNGVLIAGATESTYTTTAADEGKVVQCLVTGTNTGGATVAASARAVVVPPAPSIAPPSSANEDTTGAAAIVEVEEGKEPQVGNTLLCSPRSEAWEGEPAFSYQWLRDGVPIAGATASSYTLTGADEGKAMQCLVEGTNAGGAVVAGSNGKAVVAPEPSAKPPVRELATVTVTAAASSATTSGAATVADRLPEGLVLAGSGGSPAASGSGWKCVASGATGITCTNSTPLAPGESYSPIMLHVQVGSPPGGGVTNTAAVGGGGAATAVASDPTTIAPAVPFGIQRFATSVTERLDGPFTQADGHPFSANATFVFNYSVEHNGALWTAGGIPKDVETELPPGFIGNPQAETKCIAAQLQANTGCPASSAVGFVTVSLSGLAIEDGKANPFAGGAFSTFPVYNLQPSPGTAAAFGFVVEDSFFGLNADVRSNGDYGVTIGDTHGGRGPAGSHGLLALSYTFCGYGVSGHGSGANGSGGEMATLACAPPSPGAKPLLTNPAQCVGSAPVTTLRANTYEEPGDYVTKTVYSGTDLVGGSPSASESFVTGCNALQFAPEVEFTPGTPSEGDTTEADEPTGARFDLKVPQVGEAGVQVKTGATLTCGQGGWSPTPTEYSYMWLSDGSVIAGARAPTYTVAEGDAGTVIECGVTATNSNAGSAALSAPVIVQPIPGVALPTAITPTITGGFFFGAKEGEVLTCNPGDWTGDPTFSYQWYDRGVALSGATGATYTLRAADVPGAIQCEVFGATASGVVAAISANESTFPGAGPLPAVSEAPQISAEGVAPATPELKNATVTLPEGMTVDPSAADGLQACSNAQFGLGSTVEPAEPASCPSASQIGTVKIVTPLLEKPLEGQVFLGEPECSPCGNTDAEDGRIFRLFLQIRSIERGVIVKLAGHVTANPTTGRLQATFTEQPQLPFSELLLTFNGGARASLANPQTCGTFTTTTDLMPWSAPGLGGLSGTEPIAGTPDATPSSSFNVDWNGAGGACPGTMPFSPSFSAGSQTPTAGASSPFAVTFGRQDHEQDLSGITVSTPPGLLGKIAGIPQCPEAQANAGTCGSESEIGTTGVGAGPGPHPFYLGGKVYLTGPYKGESFGLSIVTPAVAGPFNLGTVVVRAAIAVNPSTAALTIVSDTLPQYVDGVQLRLRTINVEVNRPGFILNPTSCAQQGVGATITAAQGASVSVSSPFAVGGCQDLAFTPSFSASTQASTSKAHGASLTITVKSAPGQANIGKVDVQLPKALPARLIPTLQHACTEAQFNTNPAGCPADSFVGTATAITSILNAPLSGPAILVSRGGAAFPDLEFLLQGENGVEIVLDGKTDIKGGITYSKFDSVPDAPISSFVTTLPEGPHSILAVPGGDLCGKSLVMPTTITAQNGKQIIQKTKITITGCSAVKAKALTRAQKLKRALHVCRTKYKAKSKKAKRLVCEAQARKRYGPIKKAKKTNRRGK